MSSNHIASFTLCGREFIVLWKESAAYLRADGRMWGDSLGEDLTREEAIEQAKLRAEVMLIDERRQEEGLVHRLFDKPLDPQIERIAEDYICFNVNLAPNGEASTEGDAVWAPFNQNAYLCTQDGWRFVGNYCVQTAAQHAMAEWCASEGCWPMRNATLQLQRKKRSGGGLSLRGELKMGVWLACAMLVLFAFGWLFKLAFERWPWLLLALCTAIFVGCVVAVWRGEK